jgi:YfiH family protein
MTIYLTDKNFDEIGISYGFFGRRGGVSTGIYSSLNVGLGSGDDRDAVLQNREIIKQSLGLSNLSNLYQIHSNICHVIDAPLENVLEGDALVTSTPRVAIGVLTADCGPVLFHGKTSSGKKVIGAAHAGWGGAVKGILENTIEKMMNKGAELLSINAMIGPCIGAQSYEVSPEFLNPFLAHNERAIKFFTAKSDKFLFDLPSYIEFRLNNVGIKNVIKSDKDTYALADDYFSYRRKTHLQEPDYGRQISLICID